MCTQSTTLIFGRTCLIVVPPVFPAYQVDVLMFFTNEAVEGSGMNSTMFKETIVNMVESTNRAFIKSGIDNLQLVLVHSQMVSDILERAHTRRTKLLSWNRALTW